MRIFSAPSPICETLTRCNNHTQGWRHTAPDSLPPEHYNKLIKHRKEMIERQGYPSNVRNHLQLIVLSYLALLRFAAQTARGTTK